jgi:hypothetical protein
MVIARSVYRKLFTLFSFGDFCKEVSTKSNDGEVVYPPLQGAIPGNGIAPGQRKAPDLQVVRVSYKAACSFVEKHAERRDVVI